MPVDLVDACASKHLMGVGIDDKKRIRGFLAQQSERHARGREGERVVHNEPAVMRFVAFADRTQATGRRMVVIGEEHRILHDQHRPATAHHAFCGRLDMRREDGRGTGLRIIEQTIRGLCARPIATGLVDRRDRRLGQLLRGLYQAAIQAFVGQVGAGELRPHPFHRLGARLPESQPIGIFTSRCFTQALGFPSPHIATKGSFFHACRCVQPYRLLAQITG